MYNYALFSFMTIMLTKEQLEDALNFFEQAYKDYHHSKDSIIMIRIQNYLLGRNELNLLIKKDIAHSEFQKHGRLETDFTSAINTIRQELGKA